MKRSPLKKVSTKYSKDLAVYRKLKKQYHEMNPICHRCKAHPSDESPHHMAGRGKLLNRVDLWAALCMLCHRHVHTYPAQAMKDGWILNKFILDRNE